MKVTWHPKNLLLAVALVVVFVIALNVAIDFRVGAAACLVGLIVYLLLDVLLTLNPVRWWHERNYRSHRS